MPYNTGINGSGTDPLAVSEPKAENSGASYQGLGEFKDKEFGYTNGSLLTPWTQEFKYSGAGPSASGVNMDAFKYADINYAHSPTGDYTQGADYKPGTEITADPYSYFGGFGNAEQAGNFNYWGSAVPGQMGAPAAFQAPTGTDDPSFKFRQQNGLDAIQNTALGRGVRGGDVQQALMDYGQESASQEYAAAWQRAMGANQNAFNQNAATQQLNLASQGQEYGQAANNYQMGLQGQDQRFNQAFATTQFNEQQRQAAYDRNWAAKTGAYDRNTANSMQTFQMNEAKNLNAYNANSANNLGQGALGWQIASGNYDRNKQNAMDQWNSQYQIAASQASAAASNSSQSYNRALNEYQMAYGIYNNNQDNQYSRLYGMANLGMNANAQGINAGNNYAGQYAQNAYGAANAYGAGQMAGANAWGNAIGAAGQGASAAAMYGSDWMNGVTGGGGYDAGYGANGGF